MLTENALRSRWLEGEVLRLKRVGFSYEMIAQQITEVGRGQRPLLPPSPEDVHFPAGYKITAMGCHKAFQRALKRAPALAADEMRQLDIDRCEDMFLSLSAGVRQGDPQSVRAAIRVLALKAAINGYRSSSLMLRFYRGPAGHRP